MSYSLGMSSLDNEPINVEKLKDFCLQNPDFKFDDTKTWTNMYDQIVVLYNIDGSWDYVCGLYNGSNYADCATPDSILFKKAWEIAEELNLLIFGEENEIYYIPTYGQPKHHIDFELAKSVFAESGFNVGLIIEKATVEH